jgi:hypothetical protein
MQRRRSCKIADLDEASHFWAAALGRPVDLGHPMSRDSYRMLATPPDEPIVEIQRVEHESRVHIDIETDDIPAEVRRSKGWSRRWCRARVVMQAPTGQRFCVDAGIGHVSSWHRWPIPASVSFAVAYVASVAILLDAFSLRWRGQR